jgi:hypothetical protein
MPWNKNKKHHLFRRIKIKNIKKLFLVEISIELNIKFNNIFIFTALAKTYLNRSNYFFMFYAME